MCYGKKIQAAATKWELSNTPASSWMDGYSAIIWPSENRIVIDPQMLNLVNELAAANW